MKKILVTGGAGFIGSFLCERLIEMGHEVTCLDNFFTGAKKNIQHLLVNPEFELIRHDIVEPIKIEVDEIYNLACPASPVHYQYNAIKTVKTNIIGILNMLGIAKRVSAKILQASTSEIYGDPKVNPQVESYWGHVNPIGPRSCYDEGKRIAETLMMDYYRTHGIDIKIVRIFNTFGPRMHPEDGRVVSNFIMQALRNEPINIYSDGSQTRAFCYVSDLVEGIIRMMESENFIGPVNLGNPGEISMLDLAGMIKEMTGSKSEIQFLPARIDDPVQRNPDISLAKEKLDWQPLVPLEEGIQKTISYFEDLITGN